MQNSHPSPIAPLAVIADTVHFGAFVLYPHQQLLFKAGASVTLGGRAITLLIALATRRGETLKKSELIAIAWPKVFVEECNLRAQIRDLRRILIDHDKVEIIATVPGKGYRFVAPVTFDAPKEDTAVFLPASNHVIGRAELIQTLGYQLNMRRFVTLLGPGGAGKTTVAKAIASEMTGEFAGSVCFVDLAPVTSSDLVPGVIASAMGISCATSTPLRSVTESLGLRRFFLVLDNCEHLLTVLASIVETILLNAPHACLLVTSREPLHATGEFIHHIPSLLLPDELKKITAKEAMGYSAIQLFVSRVMARDPGFLLDDSEVETVCAICRKLDINALGIEIAAARVPTMSLQSLVKMLDGNFRLNMAGCDRSLARHPTLSAMLDLTYTTLSTQEQTMLRALSIFPGSFTIDAVKAILDDLVINASVLLPLVESLVNKSLLSTLGLGADRRFRFLETTRAYAREKREQFGETGELSRRNAAFASALLREASANLSKIPPPIWVAQYGPEIDIIRAALDWAYSPDGNTALGIELTLLCIPLWLRLSLICECRDWVEKGLAGIKQLLPLRRRQRMLLHTAAASVLLLSYGTGPKIGDHWRQVMEDAIYLDDVEHKLRALWGLWSESTCGNQYPQALRLAEDYIELTYEQTLTHHQLLAKRMHASTLFHMANLEGALQSINEALVAPYSHSSYIIDVHFDQRIAAHAVKAHIELLQGDVEKALQHIDENVAQSVTLNHPATLWYTLCFSALPMALIVDDLSKARAYLATMQKSIAKHDLPIWRQLTHCYDCVLLIRQNGPEEGLRQLTQTMNDMASQGAYPFYSLLRCEVAKGLATLGFPRQAIDSIEETMKVAASRDERWFMPELMRVKAQLSFQDATLPSYRNANQLLNQALNQAKNQGSGLWLARIEKELRSSIK
ncbi:ATP-binding protein [Pseudomonas fluorescens]|uniref:OmpR/PhoB-type domain-containing protein n=1 Tax=Pseudomonas fluorescens TaxID=294 RepID=A0A0F4V779_PSEFL|nr:winged helix-turn-helix domain-containing protein [Pseudomonas fluorescens]KJZ64589.1 hypothetical protein VD17_17120 [Pseudomonas fluorescens]